MPLWAAAGGLAAGGAGAKVLVDVPLAAGADSVIACDAQPEPQELQPELHELQPLLAQPKEAV